MLIFVGIVFLCTAWLLIRGLNSYYSPNILRSFHDNEEHFENLKEYLLKVGVHEDIEIWYPPHIMNDYVNSREELQMIEKLTWGKKTYLLNFGKGLCDKKIVLFRYVRKGDDGESPLFLIYAPNKNDIIWYVNEHSVSKAARKIVDLGDDWYYVSETLGSKWESIFG